MKKKKTLWVIGTSIAGGLTAIATVGLALASTVLAPVLNSFLETSFSEVRTSGESVTYFSSDYENVKKLAAHEEELCEKLEAEGAVLLKNDSVDGKPTLPLTKDSKVSCFSHSSVDIIYGGTGSGGMEIKNVITLKDSLEGAKLSVNPTLWDFYSTGKGSGKTYTRVNPATTGGTTSDYELNEVPWSVLESENGLADTYATYGDAAIITIARSGGEGSDLPYGNDLTGCKKGGKDAKDGDYLILNEAEREMLGKIKDLKTQGVFKKVVVLLNYSNALQLDFLDEYGIDAALWIGDPGQTGIRAVGKILAGDVNPSGRLVDTFLKDNHSSPAMQNFGVYEFTDTEERGLGVPQNNTDNDISKGNSRYVAYEEGIYLGYRYYETRYEDYVLDRYNHGDYSYDHDVAYPFGYGLSYSDFKYENFEVKSATDGSYDVSVSVENLSSIDAPHTVEIYFQSEYTEYDKTNGIEKAAVELCGFDKKVIKANAKETYTINVPKEALRVYDANGAKTYIQDGGEYYFTAGKDAHNAINNILMAKHADTTRMSGEGDASLTYKFDLEMDKEVFSVSSVTGEKITNVFDNADLNKYEGAHKTITYLSRSNWVDTFPTPLLDFKVSDEMWADGLAFDNTPERAALVEKYKQLYWADAEMPTLEKKGDLMTINYRTVDYDGVYVDKEGVEHSWDELLEQMSYKEMANVIGNAFHFTNAADSITLPRTADENGPQGFTKSLVGGVSGMCYTSEDVMAATFNLELIEDMGKCIGEDCLAANNAGLYGPGANIHRTPYSGRNFEYYSEDPFISSKVCETEVKSIQTKGVYVFTKHFALNDQENGRMGICTWANEQTIREIYLEGFEGSAKGNGSGVMTSFNRLGVVWSGAHRGLMTDILRKEWGMKGMAITDCSMFANYMDYRLGLLAGQNIWDGYTMRLEHQINNNQNDPALVSAMRESMHRIVYSISHSMAMNGIDENSYVVRVIPWWQGALIGLSAGMFTITAGCALMLYLTSKKQ